MLASAAALASTAVAPAAAQAPAGEPAAAGARTADAGAAGRFVTFADLGQSDLALRGTDGRVDVFVPRPADAPREGWQLRLPYRRSPLLDPISSMTVLVGGTPVHAARLAGPAAGTLTVDVPPALVGDAGTTFTIAGHLRLRPGACEDRHDPAQYVAFRDAAVLVPAGGQIGLDEVPDLLAGPFDPVVDIVARGEAVGAADEAAWQIGRWQSERGGTPRIGSDDPDVRLLLAVDRSSEQTAVQVARGPLPTVSLTAPSAKALSDAVRALGDEEVVDALAGTRSVLRPSGGHRGSVDPVWSDGVARFAELGVDQRRLVGPGAQGAFVAVDRPLGVGLVRTRLELLLDASTALTRSSTVRVSVAGTDLGTRRLRPGVHRYRFDVPPTVADRDEHGTPVRDLDVAVDTVLDLPDGRCQAPDPEAAQVTLLGRSAFTVESSRSAVRELGRFPAPFLDRPMIVHGPHGLDAALQVAAAYGRFSPDTARPEVLALDRLQQDRLAGRDLILLGDDVVDEVGADAPGRPTVLGDDDVDAVLAAQASPADPAHDALVVRAGDGGVSTVARLLADRSRVSHLRGRVAAVIGDRIEVVSPVPRSELPDPAELVTARRQPRAAPASAGDDRPDDGSWVLPSLVLLAALVLAGMAVVRYRWLPVRR